MTKKKIDIKIDPKNARLHNERNKQMIRKSLQELGAARSIVIDNEDYVIAGNGVLEQAEALGIKTKIIESDGTELIVVKRKDIGFNDPKRKNLAIADNATTDSSEFDYEMFEDEYFEEIDFEEWGINPLENGNGVDVKEDDYEVPEEIKTDIVLGDLIEIGEHRLLCGDSTDSDQVAKLMGGEKADMLLTDPPYGIGIDGQKKSVAKNPKHNRKAHEFRGWDTERPDSSTLDNLISQVDISVIWGGNYLADMLPASRGWIYWSKGQDGLTMSDGELAWTSEDKPLRSITVNRASLQGSVHPTQKPVGVMVFCINWAGEPNIILDAYLGSGSTMVACHQLNRKCYGMELDEKYCEVIVQRMLKLDNGLVIKVNGEDKTQLFLDKILNASTD